MHAGEYRHYKMGLICIEIVGVLIEALWRWKLWLNAVNFGENMGGNVSWARAGKSFSLDAFFIYLLKHQHSPLQQVILHAILSYISVFSVRLQLFVRTIYLFKVHRVYISNELFEIPID